MAENTKIEWADGTANFWIGCTKLSAACDHCYAEADWDHRKHRVTWGPHGARDFCKAGEQVVRKMQRGAAAFIAKRGRKPRIFVNSLSDWADNHKSILPEWRARIFELARECPDVILMLLTKRPQNIAQYLPADWGRGYPNVWLGTTAEDQKRKTRIDELRDTSAAVRFISAEPLLEDLGEVDLTGIDWVIVGGESGKHARPMHPDWARSLRDQCAAAGVAFHFKQWGEICPVRTDLIPVKPHKLGWMDRAGRVEWAVSKERCYDMAREEDGLDGPEYTMVAKVGKKRAGRLLDGVEHNGLPATDSRGQGA
jgi:protein gp37